MLSAITGFGITHKPTPKRVVADDVADKVQLIDVLPLPESFMQGMLKAAAADAFNVSAHENKQPQSQQETGCDDWRGGVEKQPSKKKLDYSRLQPQSQAAHQHLLFGASNSGVDPAFVGDAIGAFLLLSPPMMIGAPLPLLAKPPPQSKPLATFFGTPSSASLFPLSPPATMAPPEHQFSPLTPTPRSGLSALAATAVKRTPPRSSGGLMTEEVICRCWLPPGRDGEGGGPTVCADCVALKHEADWQQRAERSQDVNLDDDSGDDDFALLQHWRQRVGYTKVGSGGAAGAAAGGQGGADGADAERAPPRQQVQKARSSQVPPRPRPRTPPLRSKSGGKQCIVYGCDKNGKGPSRRCIAHGGGRRCEVNGCTKSAQGGTAKCKAHGGGKRCLVDGCTKSSRGASNKCIAHGGGKRCLIDGCGKAAQGRTKRCKAHRTAEMAAIAPSSIIGHPAASAMHVVATTAAATATAAAAAAAAAAARAALVRAI
jgi:hypothetical protein